MKNYHQLVAAELTQDLSAAILYSLIKQNLRTINTPTNLTQQILQTAE